MALTLTVGDPRRILTGVQRIEHIRRVMVTFSLAALLPAAMAHGGQPAPAPLPETSQTAIEYPSVEAALRALRARPGIVFTTERGWLIATDEADFTIWSFAPAGYPAYPAMVKRHVVPDGSGSSVVMSVHCEASKTDCDDLVRTFALMNGFDLPK